MDNKRKREGERGGAPTPKPKALSPQDFVSPLLMAAFVGVLIFGVYRFKKQQDSLHSEEEY